MAVQMHVSPQGYAVNRAFEGRSLKAYRDEVGVWTIGFGNTNYDAEVLGFTIKAGVTITADQAEQLLVAAMTRRYEPAIREAMGPDVSQPAFDAGGSFHYNTGAIKRASWVKSYVAKNLPAVHAQIMQWNKAGGNVLAGLTRRRNREWMMVSVGDYGPEGRQTSMVDERGRIIAGATAPTAAPAANAPIATPASTGGNNPHYPGMLMRGDSGPEVADEGVKLVAAGYANVPTTGVFNGEMEAAVRDFQKRHPQLTSDGVIGPATRTTLKRDADAKAKLVSTGTKGGGTSAAITTVDQASGGHLPLFVYGILGAIVVGSMLYVAWQYRDEIRAMVKSKFV